MISDGEITGAARTGAGNDTLLWTGGLVGSIDMGTDNDRATLQGLTTTNLRGITIDGGQGSDVLVFNGTVGDQPQRLLELGGHRAPAGLAAHHERQSHAGRFRHRQRHPGHRFDQPAAGAASRASAPSCRSRQASSRPSSTPA